MPGALTRADRDAANRADAALETLVYPRLCPRDHRFVLHRTVDGTVLADAAALPQARCTHEMTLAFLADEAMHEAVVLAAVFHENHYGELERGYGLLVTERADISRTAACTVLRPYFRPRDNRTAWVVLRIDDDEHGLLHVPEM